jgi:hypothetical protein
MYFDTLKSGAKNKIAYVLMIDVDRPNINVGLKFFQEWYDGDCTNSPNGIPCLFMPLYKKSYTDDERYNVIIDHDHYAENHCVVAMKGLNNMESVVKLNNKLNKNLITI